MAGEASDATDNAIQKSIVRVYESSSARARPRRPPPRRSCAVHSQTRAGQEIALQPAPHSDNFVGWRGACDDMFRFLLSKAGAEIAVIVARGNAFNT